MCLRDAGSTITELACWTFMMYHKYHVMYRNCMMYHDNCLQYKSCMKNRATTA